MPSKDGRTTEQEIGQAVLRYLYHLPGGQAEITSIKAHIKTALPLTEADREQSETRSNEEMWEQRVRNLVSHRTSNDNIIGDGLVAYTPGNLEITDAGVAYLKRKGL